MAMMSEARYGLPNWVRFAIASLVGNGPGRCHTRAKSRRFQDEMSRERVEGWMPRDDVISGRIRPGVNLGIFAKIVLAFVLKPWLYWLVNQGNRPPQGGFDAMNPISITHLVRNLRSQQEALVFNRRRWMTGYPVRSGHVFNQNGNRFRIIGLRNSKRGSVTVEGADGSIIKIPHPVMHRILGTQYAHR
jgi:hypothetical protein